LSIKIALPKFGNSTPAFGNLGKKGEAVLNRLYVGNLGKKKIQLQTK
jgi:hypothetical protein